MVFYVLFFQVSRIPEYRIFIPTNGNNLFKYLSLHFYLIHYSFNIALTILLSLALKTQERESEIYKDDSHYSIERRGVSQGTKLPGVCQGVKEQKKIRGKKRAHE